MRNLKILDREVTTRTGRETTKIGHTETILGPDDQDHTESNTKTDTITESMNQGTRETGEGTRATMISTKPQSITNIETTIRNGNLTNTEDRSLPAYKSVKLNVKIFRGIARTHSTDKKFLGQTQDLAHMTPSLKRSRMQIAGLPITLKIMTRTTTGSRMPAILNITLAKLLAITK